MGGVASLVLRRRTVPIAHPVAVLVLAGHRDHIAARGLHLGPAGTGIHVHQVGPLVVEVRSTGGHQGRVLVHGAHIVQVVGEGQPPPQVHTEAMPTVLGEVEGHPHGNGDTEIGVVLQFRGQRLQVDP